MNWTHRNCPIRLSVRFFFLWLFLCFGNIKRKPRKNKGQKSERDTERKIEWEAQRGKKTHLNVNCTPPFLYKSIRWGCLQRDKLVQWMPQLNKETGYFKTLNCALWCIFILNVFWSVFCYCVNRSILIHPQAAISYILKFQIALKDCTVHSFLPSIENQPFILK